VQKLTELGIDRIWPLLTERTVVRLAGDEAKRRAERLRRVAREAAAQSRRPWLPEVRDPCDLATALAELAGTSGGALLAEPGGGPLTRATDAVLVGPEGGWAPGELACGLDRLDLGSSVLRAETAAVVAGALLSAVHSGRLRVP
jgi:16S rRNA (uracil1498-N3)-methyltransferase